MWNHPWAPVKLSQSKQTDFKNWIVFLWLFAKLWTFFSRQSCNSKMYVRTLEHKEKEDRERNQKKRSSYWIVSHKNQRERDKEALGENISRGLRSQLNAKNDKTGIKSFGKRFVKQALYMVVSFCNGIHFVYNFIIFFLAFLKLKIFSKSIRIDLFLRCLKWMTKKAWLISTLPSKHILVYHKTSV